ncbi:MAG: hypothetical protein Q7R95_00620, partial [bacterium]|nr:hypothetical protein [bacterium]
DWYLFDSGGSFHLVIDKLVELKDIPKYYGQLIMDMAKNMSPTKSKLYGHIGKYLIENADNKKNLKQWINSVLEKFGHVDEGSANGKLVFPIDMRYIAHVLEGLENGTINEGYLRVSEKHGSVPVLIAQQVSGQIKTYEFDDNLFHRLQPRLPKF